MPKITTKGDRLHKIETLGQKLKNAKKKHAKTVSTTHCSCSMQKSDRKKTANIRKMRPF